MSCKIRPLYDRVVVRRIENERKTAGGIVIPDTAGDRPDKGEVIAVGEGRLLESGKVVPLAVKPGDTVVFNRNAGRKIKVCDEEYVFFYENEILGVIEK